MRNKVFIICVMVMSILLITILHRSNSYINSLLLDNVAALANDEWQGWEKGKKMETKEIMIGVNIDGNGMITGIYKKITCCKSSNNNDACNTANHDSRC